jgi:CarD family transcriptional regulator, regulator of rRNA transcription
VEFNVGDKVVYPSQGVSVVESITEEELAGCKMNCYTLRLLSTESKVVVPVNNSVRVGLRPLAEQTAVTGALERLSSGETNGVEDWKDRYRANLERIKTGDLDEIVDVLRCLAEVAGRKTLSFRERKMYDHARQLLVVEAAVVQEREIPELEKEIDDALGQPLEPLEE